MLRLTEPSTVARLLTCEAADVLLQTLWSDSEEDSERLRQPAPDQHTQDR